MTDPLAPSTPSPDPRPSAALPPPGARLFGKYELLAELGRGGMGVVYRALDTGLRREVALKTLHLGSADNPELVERLLREARTVAALSHPGIIPIHDVGVVAGVPYFAMTYVRGRTLSEVLRAGGLPGVRDRARVLLEAAEAVAYAHAARVVHRDLKPGNLLLDDAGRVLVMDFGLAKRLDQRTRLTAPGQILGTPQYMPPEQINGEAELLGPASDVYALGATLYEALTGHAPSEGSTVAEIVGKALTVDPVPPRRCDPRIPADLETICLAALRKEPAQRYPTAREFANDLARFLNGEAIWARPESWWERPARWARRRKALTALAAAVLLGCGAAALSAYRAGVAVRAEERLRTEALDSLRSVAAANVAAVLVARRAGARTPDLEAGFLRPLEEAVARATGRAPQLPEPQYQLGRMHRALLRFDAARAQQDLALAKDPDYAPSLYERAILNLRRYGDRIGSLRSDWAKAEGRRLAAAGPAAGTAAIARVRPMPSDDQLVARDAQACALRDAVAADLVHLERVLAPGRAGAAATAAPALSPARLACARGLHLVYTTADPAAAARARALLEDAVAAEPALEEAYEGLVSLAMGERDYARALDVYGRALAADAGYVPHLLGRGKLLAVRAGEDAAAGKDPTAGMDAARADLARAADLDPGHAGTWILLGDLGTNRVVWQLGRGQDPAATGRAAEADYTRALEADARAAEAWEGRAAVRMNLGYALAEHGGDCTVAYSSALTDCDRALAADPQLGAAWLTRGIVCADWGNRKFARGEDPTALYREAEAAYGKALELDPRSDSAWLRRAMMWTTRGNFEDRRGRDPVEYYRRAESDYRQALLLLPGDVGALMAQATLRENWGYFLESHGQDPAAIYDRGLADLDAAVRQNPGSAEAWCRRGHLRTTRAGFLGRRGQDPQPLYAEAEADYTKGLDLNSGWADAWTWRGELRTNWGIEQMNRRIDASELFARAEADHERALALDPRSADAWLGRAAARTMRGFCRMVRGEGPEELLGAALADYGKALEQNPALVDAWRKRAMIRMQWGSYRRSRGQDPAPLYDAAVRDFDSALAVNPDDAHARYGRGWVYFALERWREAVADFEAALRIDPTSAGAFKGELAEARRRLAAGAAPPAPGPAAAATQATQAARRAAERVFELLKRLR